MYFNLQKKVIQARGQVSARGRPRGRTGWCGAAAGGERWLLARGRRTRPEVKILAAAGAGSGAGSAAGHGRGVSTSKNPTALPTAAPSSVPTSAPSTSPTPRRELSTTASSGDLRLKSVYRVCGTLASK